VEIHFLFLQPFILFSKSHLSEAVGPQRFSKSSNLSGELLMGPANCKIILQ